MMKDNNEVLLKDAETGSFSISGGNNRDDDDVDDDSECGSIGEDDGRSTTSEGDTGTNASSSTDPKQNTTKQQEEEHQTIAKSENVAVFRIRLMVIAVLIICTVGVACAVWFYTSNAETTQFETEFHDDTSKIFESIGSTLDLTLGAVDAFVVSLVSFAKYSNSSWPFVTLPDYATRMAKVRSLSKAVLFSQYQVLRTEQERYEWDEYSLNTDVDSWVDNALEVQKKDSTYGGVHVTEYYTSPLYGNFGPIPNNTAPYYPSWQGYPIVPIYPPFNWDGSEYPSLARTIETMERNYEVVISNVGNLPDPDDPYNEVNLAGFNDWIKDYVPEDFDHTQPSSDMYYPIFDTAADEVNMETTTTTDDEDDKKKPKLVAVTAMTFYWRDLITNILPPGSDGLVIVFANLCNQTFTYQINGPDVFYLGPGDLHDPSYDYLSQEDDSIRLNDLKEYATGNRPYTGLPLSETSCPYTVSVYPSETYQSRFTSNDPIIFTLVAVCIFVFTSIVFLLYDFLVERRQKMVMKTAVQSSAIVSSLFPSTVRSRLYGDMDNKNDDKAATGGGGGGDGPQKNRLKTFLSDGKDRGGMDGGGSNTGTTSSTSTTDRPIADLFPETTVMFADISGFTAWSSIREPCQVFLLLETLYGSFDTIAMRRGVFKVETIGDSYVAVCGLPEPRKDHALVMAKFARDCRTKMAMCTRKLGVTLGPDTEDLSMRFGLHSGPVTAGVLRGQKSRFQLFGDTVNTASRMESTGIRHRIQVSQSTADELIKARKSHWLTPREDTIEAKGKGRMQTYFVEPKGGAGSVATTLSAVSESSGVHSEKIERLVDWNTDVLGKLIRHIIVRRKSGKDNGKKQKRQLSIKTKQHSSSMVLDEVKEIIELPDFDPSTMGHEDPDSIELDPEVQSQLREYVVAIADTYEENPFHNFEHCSHVGMSVAKLLSRILAADDVYDKKKSQGATIESSKHDLTYGITSDPLTQFACVFSALIHDADHPGVPNTQLVKEGSDLAVKYNNRSVAEQNSVDLAWDIFMSSKYNELRQAICPTTGEMNRFRQLVVNCVMATDIMDKDLKNLRNSRWERAFSDDISVEEPENVSRNRKATIVIEHLIQASDVAHTMQHWHIYRKWNEKLFEEMYLAYKDGRSDKNPADGWYEGEMGFFDFYIFPLAKKLSECGVFGVSSDEYLGYAKRNREEWERKGKEVIEKMLKKLNSSSSRKKDVVPGDIKTPKRFNDSFGKSKSAGELSC